MFFFLFSFFVLRHFWEMCIPYLVDRLCNSYFALSINNLSDFQAYIYNLIHYNKYLWML